MKNKQNLSLKTGMTKAEKKYLGDPNSPNLVPDSPLIDRQFISPQQESELKRICAIVLADVQSSDECNSDPITHLIEKLRAQETARKREKSSYFRAKPPTGPPPVPLHIGRAKGTSQSKAEVRTRKAKHEPGIHSKSAEHLPVQNPIVQPVFDSSNDEALWNIRSKLDTRPKTSAAACIDYAGDDTDESLPARSNRISNHTTYSTPATSVGVTPGETNKRFFHDGEPVEPPLPFIPNFDPQASNDSSASASKSASAHIRAFMDEQLERRRREEAEGAAAEAEAQLRPLQDFYPLNPDQQSDHLRAPTRSNSFRENVLNFLRPSSAASSTVRRTNSVNRIKNYVRPGSSTGSIRSISSTASTQSRRTHDNWSSIKRKISNASLSVSRQTSSRRKNASQPTTTTSTDDSLNPVEKPLPPLPGLDSYKEKPVHIASLMKNIVRKKPSKQTLRAEATSPPPPAPPLQRPAIHNNPSNRSFTSPSPPPHHRFTTHSNPSNRSYTSPSPPPHYRPTIHTNQSTASLGSPGATDFSFTASGFVRHSTGSAELAAEPVRPYTARSTASAVVGPSPLSRQQTAKQQQQQLVGILKTEKKERNKHQKQQEPQKQRRQQQQDGTGLGKPWGKGLKIGLGGGKRLELSLTRA